MIEREVNVLIVEDESALADSYAEWLDDQYCVRTADTGENAITALDDGPVDIVLLDRRLPDLSGEDVLDAIERRDMDCRIALVSAVEPDLDIIGLGYDFYVEKPVTQPETLHSAVETLCQRDVYDDQMRRYFALASKRGTLEAAKSRAELESSDAYQELRVEIESLESEVQDTMADLDNEDFRVEFERWQSTSGSVESESRESDPSSVRPVSSEGTSVGSAGELSEAERE